MSLSDRYATSTYHNRNGNLPDLGARPKEEMFRPLMTKKAFEQVTAEIKKLMFEGVFKPGDRVL